MQLDALSSPAPESQATEGPQIATGDWDPECQSTAELPSRLQVDFDSEVSGNLFRVKGHLAFTGNSSLSYLLLNASLLQDGRAAASTKYLLIQVEPGEDHGFEISKNMRIRQGSYDCRLEVTGPQGLLSSEARGCRPAVPWNERSSASASISSEELERKAGGQESQEDKLLREKTENGGDQGESALAGAAERMQSSLHDKQPADEPKTKSSAANGSDVSKNLESNDETAAEMRQDAKMDPSSENHSSSSLASQPIGASASMSTVKDAEAQLVGSSTSKKYHRPDCRYALKIKPENKITFASALDAQKQGYLPCKTCSP